MEHDEIKSAIRQMISSGQFPSYLAMSYALNIDAHIVRRCFWEVQIEAEMEDYSWLVE